jgi:hypothetical protein
MQQFTEHKLLTDSIILEGRGCPEEGMSVLVAFHTCRNVELVP